MKISSGLLNLSHIRFMQIPYIFQRFFSANPFAMEVTKDNFSQAYGIMQASIKEADFISIDGEFTGLSTLRGRRLTYDTLEDKFWKLKKGTSQFLLIQYGICLFKWNDDANQYEAMPFTFYIYPRPYKRTYNDVMFMCQSSSLDFLANNGFDFNKLFYKGISYLSPWHEVKARERLEKDLSYCAAEPTENDGNQNTPKSKVFIPKANRVFIDSITLSVDKFLESDETTLDLPPCNAFLRKIIYEVLEEKYPLGLYLESVQQKDSSEKFIRAVKVTLAGLTKMKNESCQKEIEYFEEIFGFTKVMTLLSEAKKPLIGHNMLLDLFLTVFNFYDNTIESFKDFKLFLNSLFPLIFDTKFMASNQAIAGEVQGTSLQKLYEHVTDGDLPNPEVVISEKFKEVEKAENQFHQAGYDAYCTGFVFISLSKFLCSRLSINISRVDLNHDVIVPFANKINMHGIRDIFYVNIAGPDNIPSRKDVFHLTFPKGYNETDFEALFSPICPLIRPTVWISDTTAFVTIDSIDRYDEVCNNLVGNNQSTNLITVRPYSSIIQHQEAEEIKRNVVSSSSEEAKPNSKRKREEKSEKEDGELNSDDDVSPQKKKSSGLFEIEDEW